MTGATNAGSTSARRYAPETTVSGTVDDETSNGVCVGGRRRSDSGRERVVLVPTFAMTRNFLLNAAFNNGWNPRAQLFVWTKTAEQILKKANRPATTNADH